MSLIGETPGWPRGGALTDGAGDEQATFCYQQMKPKWLALEMVSETRTAQGGSHLRRDAPRRRPFQPRASSLHISMSENGRNDSLISVTASIKVLSLPLQSCKARFPGSQLPSIFWQCSHPVVFSCDEKVSLLCT